MMREIPGDVVHAGTFFGDFLPALADRDGIVWAFEPNRESFRCAEVTVLLNDLQNVRLTHAALSDARGTAHLVTANGQGVPFGGESFLRQDEPNQAQYEDVPLVTVDEAVPADRHVGVLQLDVEGHERPALSGAQHTIARCRPVLILESVPAQDWFDRLQPRYRMTNKVDGNSIFRPVE